jgi:lysophospholipase L1-like esterase
VQLAARLRERGQDVAEPVIIAKTGWTTGELLTALAGKQLAGPFDLVTLLIGVNNQYRGLTLGEYREEFRELLRQAAAFTANQPERVLALSIPDWSSTPFAAGRDRSRIAGQIDAFNQVNREEAQAAGAVYVDITPLSRQYGCDAAWLAGDRLHPAGRMYAAWVKMVLPLALAVLQD